MFENGGVTKFAPSQKWNEIVSLVTTKANEELLVEKRWLVQEKELPTFGTKRNEYNI